MAEDSGSCPSSWMRKTFTSPEFEKLQEKMAVLGTDLVKEAQDNTTFKLIGTKNRVQMYTGKKDNSKILMVKGQTLVKCKDSIIQNSLALYTTERMNHVFERVDPMFSTGRVLNYYPANYKSPDLPVLVLKWGRYAVGPILNDRDFVWAEFCDKIEGTNGEKDVGFGVATSLYRDEFPELPEKGFVRGEIFTTGYVFRTLEEELIELSYIVQVDPKGLLPAWAVNLTVKQQAQNVARMRDWLEMIYEATTVLEQNHPSKEPIYGVVEDIPLARRGTHTHEIDTEPGEVVYFRCWSSNGAVKLNISGHSTAQWQGDLSHGSDEKPVIGEVVANASKVTFTWTNEGWMTGRKLFYFVENRKDREIQVSDDLDVFGNSDGDASRIGDKSVKSRGRLFSFEM